MLHGPSVSTDDRKIVRDLPAATDSQAAFLAGSDQADPNRAHIEQIVLDAPSDILAPGPLLAAWQQLSDRHETLRTVLVTDDTGILRLDVLDHAPVHMDSADLSDGMVDRFLADDRAAGVDPTERPGWRVTMADLGGGRPGWSGPSTTP